MKALKIAGFTLAAMLGIYAILVIGQIWGNWFAWDTFIKISITLGVGALAIGIIALIFREISEDKELKKDNFID